jgi:hypothetical protein
VALDPGAASQALAIEGPKKKDWVALAEGALSSEDVRDLWRQALAAGDVLPGGPDPLSKQLMAIATRKDEENVIPRPAAPVPDEDGAVDAELVEEGVPDSYEPTAWPEVAKVGGAR